MKINLQKFKTIVTSINYIYIYLCVCVFNFVVIMYDDDDDDDDKYDGNIINYNS
jgi:hypothetical protein